MDMLGDAANIDGAVIVRPGEDGFDLIAQVRQLPAASACCLPALALTAYARSEDRARSLQCGFQVHLSKPINPVELAAAVLALAQESSGMAS